MIAEDNEAIYINKYNDETVSNFPIAQSHYFFTSYL